MKSTVYRFNCALLFNEENNGLYLCRRGDKSIRQLSPHKFLISYCKYINKSDESIKSFIFSIIKGDETKKWITPELQSKQGILETINRLYKEQCLDVREQYLQYDRSNYVEITTYNLIKDIVGHTIIDFDHPEYVKFSRTQIRVSDNTVKYIDYALCITENNLASHYKKGNILFVQNTKNVKKGNIIFYATKTDGFIVKQCITKVESESIYQHIDTPQKDILSCGRILYSLIPNLKQNRSKT